MLEYWRELESAWAVDLDLEEGDSAVHMPEAAARYASDPPPTGAIRGRRASSAWPSSASAARSSSTTSASPKPSISRGEVQTMFPEGELSDEKPRSIREALEYAISGSVLELDCARLAVYHELAAGDSPAAADIANLALSASGALSQGPCAPARSSGPARDAPADRALLRSQAEGDPAREREERAQAPLGPLVYFSEDGLRRERGS